MTMKAYKHWQSAQTMVIYLVPPTEVSLLDSQYLKSLFLMGIQIIPYSIPEKPSEAATSVTLTFRSGQGAFYDQSIVHNRGDGSNNDS